MSKRALRRHHRERVRRRCVRILKFQGWHLSHGPEGIDLDWVERCARYRADNFSVCSCWMCGNPRRLRNSNGPSLTIQERLADLREQVLLDEGSDG